MPQICLFATRDNTQLRKFVPWIPDPQSAAIDAFTVQWSDPLSYAFSPFSLIIRCVQRIKSHNEKILLATSVWRSRPWYPFLFPLPVSSPIQSTPTPTFQKALKPQLNINKLTLAAWLLSGNASLNTRFLRGCQKSYSPHGAQEQNLSINSVWRKWYGCCMEREINPVSCDLNFVLEFLTDPFYQNYQHRTINVYRRTISASHLPIDGSPVDSNQPISRFMKSICELRPPQPCLFTTWSVLNFLKLLLRGGIVLITQKFHPA